MNPEQLIPAEAPHQKVFGAVRETIEYEVWEAGNELFCFWRLKGLNAQWNRAYGRQHTMILSYYWQNQAGKKELPGKQAFTSHNYSYAK